MRLFRFCYTLLYLNAKFLPTSRTSHLMLTRFSGQAQGGLAVRAGAEDVIGGVGGKAVLGLAAEFRLEAEPGFILPTALGNVAGKEAV